VHTVAGCSRDSVLALLEKYSLWTFHAFELSWNVGSGYTLVTCVTFRQVLVHWLYDLFVLILLLLLFFLYKLSDDPPSDDLTGWVVTQGHCTSKLYKDIERVQKHCLRIIFPQLSYSEALDKSGLDTRREEITEQIFRQIKSPIHPLHYLIPPPKVSSSQMILRPT